MIYPSLFPCIQGYERSSIYEAFILLWILIWIFKKIVIIFTLSLESMIKRLLLQGDKIMLAAGSALEPFWSMYAIHLNNEAIEFIKEYRIGTLPADERAKEVDLTDAYAQDPDRSNLNVKVTL